MQAIPHMKQIHYYRIIEFIAAIFILLFTYTAFSKLLGFTAFKNTLAKSPLIGNYAAMLAVAVPLIELIIAVLLIIPQKRKLGLYASFTLMLLFTIYLGYMILFTSGLPCSCGGVLQQMTWPQHLWFNTGFTIVAAIGLRMHRKFKNSIPVQDPA